MNEQLQQEIDAIGYRAFLAFYEVWLESGAPNLAHRLAAANRMSELAQWLDEQAQALAEDLDREVVTVYNVDGESWFLESFEAALAPAGLVK